jgi:hypothetical protein
MKKIRQFCEKCKQITTQTKNDAASPWNCLCCESVKFRSKKATLDIKKKINKKPKLNLSF